MLCKLTYLEKSMAAAISCFRVYKTVLSKLLMEMDMLAMPPDFTKARGAGLTDKECSPCLNHSLCHFR